MTDDLDGHIGTVSIGGTSIIHLSFTDDIGGVTGGKEKLQQLVERL